MDGRAEVGKAHITSFTQRYQPSHLTTPPSVYNPPPAFHPDCWKDISNAELLRITADNAEIQVQTFEYLHKNVESIQFYKI